MKRLGIGNLILAGSILLAVPATATNVVWVSPNTPGPSDAATALGFTEPPDIGYTNLLASEGLTVTRLLPQPAANNTALPPADLATMNAADLVIISRSVNSGTFDNVAEIGSWVTEITTPVMILSGYGTRNNRLGLTTGTTIPDIAGPTRLLANVPGHPIFDGITLDGNNETATFFDLVTAPIDGNPIQRGTSINSNSPQTGGTLIASITSDSAVAPGGTVIAEFSAGTASAFTGGGDFASKWMLFFTGSREVDGNSSDSAGIIDLSDDGRQMFLNAVDYLTTVFTPGDTDGDGIGGEYPDDFDPIRNNFRRSPRTREDGDLTGNGVVDFADFREWKAAALASGTSLDGIDVGFLGVVPEPSSIVLLAMTCLSIGALTRQRRSA